MARSKYEIRAQKELEKQGYEVDNKAGMARWAKNRDFWNVFDLVAKKEGDPLRWISIKGTMGVTKKHRKEVKECWLPDGNTKEIWARSKGKSKYWNKVILKKK